MADILSTAVHSIVHWYLKNKHIHMGPCKTGNGRKGTGSGELVIGFHGIRETSP